MSTEKFDKLVKEEQVVFDEKVRELVELFVKKAEDNLKSAKIEFLLLKDKKLREEPLIKGYSSFEWAIVKSYYAMYNLVRALLAKLGVKTLTHFSTLFAFKTLYIEKRLIKTKYLKLIEDVKEIARVDEGYLDDMYDVKKVRFSVQYDVKASIIEKQAVECLEKAEKFVEDLKKNV